MELEVEGVYQSQRKRRKSLQLKQKGFGLTTLPGQQLSLSSFSERGKQNEPEAIPKTSALKACLYMKQQRCLPVVVHFLYRSVKSEW